MDFYGIKENVESIHMPEHTRRRIIQNLEHRKEHPVMKKHYRKSLTIAAALALCLALPLGVGAAGKHGYFRDIIGWNGAIVGTDYENATEEIGVTGKTEGDNLLVSVRFLTPEKFPYRTEESLAIGSYYFTDAAGNRIADFVGTDSVPLSGNSVTFQLKLVEGAKALHIENFIGIKKADQDLTISGNWEVILP